jgi:hypothetical protein
MAKHARNGNDYKVRSMVGQMNRCLLFIFNNEWLDISTLDAPSKFPRTIEIKDEDTVVPKIVFSPCNVSPADLVDELKRIASCFQHFWQTTSAVTVRYILFFKDVDQDKISAFHDVIDQEILFSFLDLFTSIPLKVEGMYIVKSAEIPEFLDTCAKLGTRSLSYKLQNRFHWCSELESALE